MSNKKLLESAWWILGAIVFIADSCGLPAKKQPVQTDEKSGQTIFTVDDFSDRYFGKVFLDESEISSEYVKADMLPQIKSELQQCVEIEKAIEDTNDELNRLEAAAMVLNKSLYHKLIILRRCSVMDSMPVDMRKKSLEFGNAMTALEGIPASEDTEETLSLWAEGQYSFTDGYLKILIKYRLIEV